MSLGSPEGGQGECSALSTAFKPFTPVAPPVDVLIPSHPVPSGWQLTDGTGKEVPWASARWRPRRDAGMSHMPTRQWHDVRPGSLPTGAQVA